ncbi:MAG: alpha/beta fold hydrolase, partial [Thermodesulfobacteriota bacterium]
GDSDKPTSGFNYTIEEQADLIVKIAEKLQIPKFHVAGVSYGGVIALNLSTRYPEKVNKVVCIEGGVIKPKRLPHQYKKEVLRIPLIGHFIISAIRSGLFDWITAQVVMGEAWKKLSDEERREILEIISQNNKTASQGSWSRIARTFKNSKDFVEEVKSLKTPVLYLYGESSEFRRMTEMNVELFNKHLPHIEIVSFKDGVHNLELQKPKEIAELILEFFNRDGFREQ